MNLPNKLTVIRVALIPVFLVLFFSPVYGYFNNFLLALIVFAVASFTDMLDGKIARKYNLVTNFGKLMDPLADKLLVISAMVCILCGPYAEYSAASIISELFGKSRNYLTFSLVCLIIVLAREFIVTSIRLVAAEKGVVIAADIFGKLKTVTQMVWVCLELLYLATYVLYPAAMFPSIMGVVFKLNCLIFAAMMLLTVFSGFNYVWKNRKLFADA